MEVKIVDKIDTLDDMKAKGKTDKDLEDILGWVNLLHILEREGSNNVTRTLTQNRRMECSPRMERCFIWR